MLRQYRFVQWGVVCLFTVVLFLLEACGPSISTPSAAENAPALATVKADIACRTGPTTEYPVQDTLKAGEILSIKGRNQSGDAWVVFNPDLQDTCWVEGAWLAVAGAMSQVMIVNPEPPPAPSATVRVDAVCRSGPTADYEVRDTLKAGEILDIQGRSRSGAMPGGCSIRTSRITAGWRGCR